MAEFRCVSNLSPMDIIKIIKAKEDKYLYFEETKECLEGKIHTILIFQRYFLRSMTWGTLTVIIDNLNGITEVRAFAAPTSRSSFSNSDAGASEKFVDDIRKILEQIL